MIVSIALFFLILIFLYKALEITKSSNDFFSSKVSNIVSTNKIKKVLIEDIAEADEKGIELSYDKNFNSILQIKTKNMYHDVFYEYVVYFISKENNLLRIESLKKFDKFNLNEDFFNQAYIDILTNDIEKFEVVKMKENKEAYTIMLRVKKENDKIFVSLKI